MHALLFVPLTKVQVARNNRTKGPIYRYLAIDFVFNPDSRKVVDIVPL